MGRVMTQANTEIVEKATAAKATGRKERFAGF